MVLALKSITYTVAITVLRLANEVFLTTIQHVRTDALIKCRFNPNDLIRFFGVFHLFLLGLITGCLCFVLGPF